MQYLPGAITAHFEERYKGLRLRFVEEEKPLGTAGCVRFAAGKAADNREEILVISGDALTSVDLTAAREFHRQKGAAVTLVVTHVEDPREYGLVEYAPDGRVTGFLEKPAGPRWSPTPPTRGYISCPRRCWTTSPRTALRLCQGSLSPTFAGRYALVCL